MEEQCQKLWGLSFTRRCIHWPPYGHNEHKTQPAGNQKKSNINYDWKSILENKNIQNQFALAVKNRYEALQTENTSCNEAYENFVKSYNEATKSLIPTKEKKKQNIPWENETIRNKREEISRLAQSKNRCMSR